MPQMSPDFTVECPIEHVWNYISNMENIGSSIPDCTVEAVDDDTTIWAIHVDMGLLSKTFRLTCNVLERDEAAHTFAFEAKGSGITAQGNGTLESVQSASGKSDGATHVALAIDISAAGLGASMINAMIAQSMDECSATLINDAKEVLES